MNIEKTLAKTLLAKLILLGELIEIEKTINDICKQKLSKRATA